MRTRRRVEGGKMCGSGQGGKAGGRRAWGGRVSGRGWLPLTLATSSPLLTCLPSLSTTAHLPSLNPPPVPHDPSLCEGERKGRGRGGTLTLSSFPLPIPPSEEEMEREEGEGPSLPLWKEGKGKRGGFLEREEGGRVPNSSLPLPILLFLGGGKRGEGGSRPFLSTHRGREGMVIGPPSL